MKPGGGKGSTVKRVQLDVGKRDLTCASIPLVNQTARVNCSDFEDSDFHSTGIVFITSSE